MAKTKEKPESGNKNIWQKNGIPPLAFCSIGRAAELLTCQKEDIYHWINTRRIFPAVCIESGMNISVSVTSRDLGTSADEIISRIYAVVRKPSKIAISECSTPERRESSTITDLEMQRLIESLPPPPNRFELTATIAGLWEPPLYEPWREGGERVIDPQGLLFPIEFKSPPDLLISFHPAERITIPAIGLAGCDGFGLHFYEQSSAGKTTTANVASSLYGSPDDLRLTWYGTALGMVNEAAAHNDGLMPLDEVGQGADPRAVAQSAYALFNGVGKIQGAKEGGNRELKRWRTMAISTGEMDLETFISTTGQKVKAGQLVRLLNVPLTKATAFHGLENGKRHSDAIKDAYQNHYGAAGREWIKWLADHQHEAIQKVRECEERWRHLIPADYGEQVHRVGARFAILEAALLLGCVVTGWGEQSCRDAVQHAYNTWVMEFGTGNREHLQAISQCEAFLNAYGLSRFAPYPYDPASLPIRDLAGYRKGGSDDEKMTFYTFPAAFEAEIAQGFNPKQFAEILKNAGMLTPPAKGRGYQRKSPRINGRQFNVYVLAYLPASEGGE